MARKFPEKSPSKRFTAAFLLGYIPATIFDVWTTHLGSKRPGTEELNPRGFLSLGDTARIEVTVLAVGTLLILVASWFARPLLVLAGEMSWRRFLIEFCWRPPLIRLISSLKYLGLIVLLICFDLILLRYCAVLNNSMNLIFDGSVFAFLILDPLEGFTPLDGFQAYLVMIAIIGTALFLPAGWIVHAIAKGRDELPNRPDEA